MTPTGRYFDGQTARPYVVDIQVAGLGVEIRGVDCDLKTTWRFVDVRLLEAPEENRPAVITNETVEGARLTFTDAKLYRAIAAYAPLSAPGRVFLSTAWQALIGWTIAAIAVVGIVAWGYPRLAEPAAFFVPDTWRAALGAQVIKAMTADRKVCSAQPGRTALDDLTARLVAAAPSRERLKVRVISGKPVNAFAAPGGEVVLFEALILQAEGPDEVAGILAHEIGHVVHRHPTAGVIRGIGLATLVQFMFSGIGSDNIAAAAQIYALTYNREAETEADLTAAEMLRRAGMSPHGLITFFERLQAEGRSGGDEGFFKYFSSHPALGDRVDRLSSETQQKKAPALTDDQWRSLRAICGTPEGEET